MSEAAARGRVITVSVIIPTYNRAHSLAEALDSVLVQDPPADEVIVIDDGSTDGTPEVLSAYGDRIIALRQENAGAAAARNLGLAHASGEWIAFLDSDDLWREGRLALLHRDLEKDESEDVILHVADLSMTGEGYDQSLFELRGWSFGDHGSVRVNDPLPQALSGLSLCSSAVRRDIALATNRFPEDCRIYEDAHFFCEVSLAGPALFSSRIVTEARRVSMDTSALSSIERRYPIEAAEASVAYIDNIFRKNLVEHQRRFVASALSGAHFTLAAAKQKAGNPGEKSSLIKSITFHPSKLRGGVKVLIVLVFRSFGYRFVLGGKKEFSRS